MVRFTQPAEFNDPFELRPHVRGVADDELINRQHAQTFQSDALASQVSAALAELQISPPNNSPVDLNKLVEAVGGAGDQVLAFVRTLSGALAPAVATQMSRLFNEQLGIFCLTEDPLNLLMWAHYGDNHRGVVIEFDETHPFFTRRKGPRDDLRHFRQVTYTEHRPSVFLSRSDAVQLFYCKSIDWSYEREWRLITPLTDATKTIDNPDGLPICLFEVPSDAVRGLIFGCRSSTDVHLQISGAIRGSPDFHHVALSRATEDELQFELHRRIISAAAIDAWLAQANTTA